VEEGKKTSKNKKKEKKSAKSSSVQPDRVFTVTLKQEE
jgi:hypothetical protein